MSHLLEDCIIEWRNNPLHPFTGITGNLQTTVNQINATLNTKASQVSVNNLQTTSNAIKANTDSIPALGTNVTAIGFYTLPKTLDTTCSIATNLVFITVSQPTRFDRILIEDADRSTTWQLTESGFSISNEPPSVSQVGANFVVFDSREGLPLTTSSGLDFEAASAMANDQIDIHIGFSGPVAPTISCGWDYPRLFFVQSDMQARLRPKFN